jgi:ubiquinone/menaquinone biosynthesis C-methylase UbiE
MQTLTEVERLQQVYRGYSGRGFGESKWSAANRGNQMILDEYRLRLGRLLAQAGLIPLRKQRILDLGCGAGSRLATFLDWGAQPEKLFGVDLIPERIRAARTNYPQLTFELANAEQLPFKDSSLDLVLVSTVFSSILDHSMTANICREISRVLIFGGAVAWYDFRMPNPLNRHVRGISRRKIQELFPSYELELETITLLPPLARRLGALTDALYPALSSIAFFRSHYLGLLIKP